MPRKPTQPTSVDRVRDFIETYRQRTGLYPTYGEIRMALNYHSKDNLRRLLRQIRKGVRL